MPFSIEQALEYLNEAYSKGRLAHAFLVSGREGSGKRRLTKDLFQMILNSARADEQASADL